MPILNLRLLLNFLLVHVPTFKKQFQYFDFLKHVNYTRTTTESNSNGYIVLCFVPQAAKLHKHLQVQEEMHVIVSTEDGQYHLARVYVVLVEMPSEWRQDVRWRDSGESI